jgi:retinol dehydrogenase-12
VRQLADLVAKSEKGNNVTVSIINPGAVVTDIMREGGVFIKVYAWLGQTLVCRPTEEGARTLVHAAEGAEETHGQYLNDCKIGQ